VNRKYKKRIIIFSIIGALVVFVIAAAIFILTPRGKPLPVLETEVLYSVIKDGDIICRLGDRLWSEYFKDISDTDKRFSHMGVVRIDNGKITVIHAEGTTEPGKDFVKEQDLSDFLKIARAIGIYRIKDIDGSQISKKALNYINLPFDWQFDNSDESKIYCTELLYVILKQLKPELVLSETYVKEWGRYIIPLEAISNSDFFQEVCFIDGREKI